MAIKGIAAVLLFKLPIAKRFIQGICGIWRVAFGTRVVAIASSEMDDVHTTSVTGGFRFRADGVVRVPAVRLGTIGHDGRRVPAFATLRRGKLGFVLRVTCCV